MDKGRERRGWSQSASNSPTMSTTKSTNCRSPGADDSDLKEVCSYGASGGASGNATFLPGLFFALFRFLGGKRTDGIFLKNPDFCGPNAHSNGHYLL